MRIKVRIEAEYEVDSKNYRRSGEETEPRILAAEKQIFQRVLNRTIDHSLNPKIRISAETVV